MNSLSENRKLSEFVILFDGVCNLCNSSVNFIIARDKSGKFKFSALQSSEAMPYVELCPQQKTVGMLNTILLVEKGRCYAKSTAALRIAKRLDGAWPVLYFLILVPRFIRDRVYDWIAQNRYNWFGRTETCRLPTPELRGRFLDGLQEPA